MFNEATIIYCSVIHGFYTQPLNYFFQYISALECLYLVVYYKNVKKKSVLVFGE